ncbi:hypothetical protein CAPTEDRAFT_184988 [Capitella teleta]|uniref:Uncharacterized protein n=1 Tax=Capitella teleta TaxID=283909 RepID=R7TAN8_CAPTE|nr:hypothetical protein CAPTEDRAFT_184988 [Capitella teleta]|eukprot:ELT88547.1 hypothetical protein CAPTEDRAFT_184988 [Capitella teleta]
MERYYDKKAIGAFRGSTQDYINPAFESDASSERAGRNGLTPSTSRVSLSVSSNPDGSSRRPSPSGGRKSSMAEVAMALTPSGSVHGSTSDVRQATISASSFLAHLRRTQHQYKYVHPFGNSTSILEELLCEDDDEALTRGKAMGSSPAKLVLWIVFCGFMVGVAGAIILGAGFPDIVPPNLSCHVVTETFGGDDSTVTVTENLLTETSRTTTPPG